MVPFLGRAITIGVFIILFFQRRFFSEQQKKKGNEPVPGTIGKDENAAETNA
jgi:hypothetical protein